MGPSGEFDETIDVDGTLRSWRVHVPESAVDAMAFGPVPLLIALHGAGDSGANFLAATGLKTTAAANGFVLVGPQGYNAGWFVKTQEGWPGTDGNGSSLQNDAQLMTEILEVTSQHYWIDEARVFAVGFSRGAGLAGLLAILSGQMALPSGPWKSPFAAYGIDAGYDPMGGQVDVSLAAPKRAVWLIHGTADAGVPYNFGKSFADALQAGGWDVLFTTIDGAPHTWLWQPAFGYSNQDLWDFFAAHPADAS
ncbi:MAG: hypothetical protein FJ098_02470 [Deltaproteobacteria bacterium]|nr:hypothetical protein [Deltaproteobacteria bacterium]